MNSVAASAKGSGRLRCPRPLRRAEGVVLELLQLGVVGAMRALELQMLTDCLVENAHVLPGGNLKPMRYILGLAKLLGRPSRGPISAKETTCHP